MTITITLLVLALGALGLERERRAGKRAIERDARIDALADRYRDSCKTGRSRS